MKLAALFPFRFGIETHVLGIANTYADVAEWPEKFQPDLSQRAHLWRRFRDLEKQQREGKNGQDTEAAKQANRRENLMRKKDELKFVQRNIYGADQVKLRLTAFWANHFTIGNTLINGMTNCTARVEGITNGEVIRPKGC